MARTGKNAARWSPVLVLGGLSALLFASDQPHLGRFLLLSGVIPYLLLLAPLRCRATTNRGTRCRRTGVGLFIGCHDHRFVWVAQRLSRRPVQYRRAPVVARGARSGGLPAAEPGLRVYEIVTLAVAVASMAAGVWAAIKA